MSYISLSQAFANWKELAADIPKDDDSMLSESWNDYTDSLCKGGELCALQYHYAPAYDDDMPGEGSRYDELSDDRAFILDAMGVTLSAEFVPFAQSRNKDEKEPSLNWRVTLKLRDREVLTADYMQGSGHCPAYQRNNFNTPTVNPKSEKRAAIAYECATGFEAKGGMMGGTFKRGRKLEPELTDVFYSLLSDSSVLDCRDFADWASDFGMDSDSIKARAMYDACMADALKMRAAFGDKTMSELRELFEGM